MASETVEVAGAGDISLVVDITRPWEPGKEPAFLLVHGLSSNARLWDGVARYLEDGGFASAAVDQRGHGRSDKPDDGYDYDTLCTDLQAVMEVLARTSGCDEIVAVGQSFGGNLVLELAARDPEGLAGVACVDGGVIDLAARFGTFEEAEQALAPPKLAGLRRDVLERQIRQAHADWPDEAIDATMANLEVLPDGTVAPWLTLPRHLAILRTMWSSRPRDAYPKIDVPVLLMPVDSPDAPEEWSRSKHEGVEEAVSALSDVEVRWFSPADHDVHAQYPEQVGDALVSRFAGRSA